MNLARPYAFILIFTLNFSFCLPIYSQTPISNVPAVSSISCHGLQDGEINLVISGGIQPYSFTWSTGDTTQFISNLGAGNYTVTISGNNTIPSCPWTINSTLLAQTNAYVIIDSPSSGPAAIGDTIGVFCLDTSTGNHVCVGLGKIINNSGYSYSISLYLDNPNTPVKDGLQIGDYIFFKLYRFGDGSIHYIYYPQVTWSTDQSLPWFTNTCGGTVFLISEYIPYSNQYPQQIIQSFQISEPPPLNLTATYDEILCYGAASSIQFNASGGTPPYLYPAVTSVNAGNYNFILFDNHGCQDSLTLSITQPEELILSANYGEIACHGAETEISFAITGGVSPYQIPANQTIIADTYTFVATDNLGCTDSVIIEIQQPDYLILSPVFDEIDCFGNESFVSFVASGGTFPYILPGDTLLPAGQYTMEMEDANGCIDSVDFTMVEPAPFSMMAIPAFDTLCYGAQSFITFSATGGTLPYQLPVNTYYSGGIYTVNGVDSHGCYDSASFQIMEYPELILIATNTPINCYGDQGLVSFNASGGVPPYNLPGNSLLGAGTYSFTLSDHVGCITNTNITITQPNELFLVIGYAPLQCFGDETYVLFNPVGGTPPYQVPQNAYYLAGDYNFTLTDSLGCIETREITINQPSEIEVDSIISPATSQLANDGSIQLIVTGGTPPYSYLWSNGLTSQNVLHQPSGSYSISISDANDCTVQDTLFIPYVQSDKKPFELPIRIYPNPTSSFLYITDLEPESIISVHTQTGQLIGSIIAADKEYLLDVTAFQAGTYIINIENKGRFITKRIEIF